uniref:Secreted protein n=1 Tax=Pyxicephalus adspersus TaxID=30357 RepID=A0AAV3AKX6_PYXAD|nr:TPA: hypothetical protein GDO54_011331 [Pyxicephalus adspersus]
MSLSGSCGVWSLYGAILLTASSMGHHNLQITSYRFGYIRQDIIEKELKKRYLKCDLLSSSCNFLHSSTKIRGGRASSSKRYI